MKTLFYVLMADRGPASGAPTEEWRGLSRYGMHLHPHLCRNRANAAARHRRAGSFFRRRRKPPWKSIAPNSPSHDRLLRSHVVHHLPTYAFLLAGLRATLVGNVPVEVVSSDAWIARPSRKQHLSITRPHAVGALGETSCTSFSISADLIANVNQLFHEARLIGASGDRSRAPPSPTTSCAPSLQLWTATPTTPSAPASRYRRPGKPLLHCHPISGCSTHRSTPSPSTFFLDRRWTPWAQLTTTYSTSRRAFPPRVSPLY